MITQLIFQDSLHILCWMEIIFAFENISGHHRESVEKNTYLTYITYSIKRSVFIYKFINVHYIFISILNQVLNMWWILEQNCFDLNSFLPAALSKLLNGIPAADIVCLGEEEKLWTDVGFFHQGLPQPVIVDSPGEKTQQCIVDAKYSRFHQGKESDGILLEDVAICHGDGRSYESRSSYFGRTAVEDASFDLKNKRRAISSQTVLNNK